MKLIDPIKARVVNVPQEEKPEQAQSGMSLRERLFAGGVGFVIFSAIVLVLEAWPK